MTRLKIAFIGDFWSEDETKQQRSFVGPVGEIFNTLLTDAGIRREDCLVTSVFHDHPPKSDVTFWCGKLRDPDVLPDRPALARGAYLRAAYGFHLERLYGEVAAAQPNVVVCLGAISAWAILGSTSVAKIRGTCSLSMAPPGLKTIPTFSPRDLFRQYDQRHTLLLDLLKAKRESEFPEIVRPVRELWLDPTLGDIKEFYSKYIADAKEVAYDVETANMQITCLSLAPSPARALVIPFLDYRKPGSHYWATLEEEVEAWNLIRRALTLPSAHYVGQNALYDVQYLWKAHGIPARLDHDTMLLHHALQPESQKSLGFLGSIYTNEIAWKPQRPKGKHNEKPEDGE